METFRWIFIVPFGLIGFGLSFSPLISHRGASESILGPMTIFGPIAGIAFGLFASYVVEAIFTAPKKELGEDPFDIFLLGCLELRPTNKSKDENEE